MDRLVVSKSSFQEAEDHTSFIKIKLLWND